MSYTKKLADIKRNFYLVYGVSSVVLWALFIFSIRRFDMEPLSSLGAILPVFLPFGIATFYCRKKGLTLEEYRQETWHKTSAQPVQSNLKIYSATSVAAIMWTCIALCIGFILLLFLLTYTIPLAQRIPPKYSLIVIAVLLAATGYFFSLRKHKPLLIAFDKNHIAVESILGSKKTTIPWHEIQLCEIVEGKNLLGQGFTTLSFQYGQFKQHEKVVVLSSATPEDRAIVVDYLKERFASEQ